MQRGSYRNSNRSSDCQLQRRGRRLLHCLSLSVQLHEECLSNLVMTKSEGFSFPDILKLESHPWHFHHGLLFIVVSPDLSHVQTVYPMVLGW